MMGNGETTKSMVKESTFLITKITKRNNITMDIGKMIESQEMVYTPRKMCSTKEVGKMIERMEKES